jgi:hypothetical protein
MQFGRDIRMLAACLCIISSPAAACDVGATTAAINSIAEQLLARQVQRIELLKISDRLLASIPVSPEHFSTYPHERHTLQLTERDSAELAAVVKKLELTQLDYQPDLRWQLVLLDGSGSRLHAIFLSKRYLQGRGRSGYVDGSMCGFRASAIGSPALVRWLQKRLPK